jgi:outer membrane lipoprotein-sorting protein
MNKKFVAIMLSVILALALTTSCGKKSTTPFTITSTTPATSVQTTTSKPPTSTSLTGAPTSSTPTTSVTMASTTTTTKPITTTPPVTSSTPTTSVQPTTSTTTRPTTTSAPPSSTAESIFDILGRATSVTTVEYDMEITAGAPTPNVSTSHIWMKGTKMRMDTGSGSQKVTILVDNAARTSIIIMGTFAMSQNWTEQDTPTGQAEDIMSYKPVYLGDETFDGKLCSVIQYSYTPAGAGAITAKAWIWKQYGFPIKVESTDSTGKKTTMLYKNIIIGGDIPDSTFVVPPGIPLMSGFPTGIPTGFPGM